MLLQHEHNLNRLNRMQDIDKNRLDHMSSKILAKGAKLKRQLNRSLEFGNLMEELSVWIQVVQHRTNNVGQVAKVAATEVTSELPPTRPQRRSQPTKSFADKAAPPPTTESAQYANTST